MSEPPSRRRRLICPEMAPRYERSRAGNGVVFRLLRSFACRPPQPRSSPLPPLAKRECDRASKKIWRGSEKKEEEDSFSSRPLSFAEEANFFNLARARTRPLSQLFFSSPKRCLPGNLAFPSWRERARDEAQVQQKWSVSDLGRKVATAIQMGDSSQTCNGGIIILPPPPLYFWRKVDEKGTFLFSSHFLVYLPSLPLFISCLSLEKLSLSRRTYSLRELPLLGF